jgi:four helix bundle protein
VAIPESFQERSFRFAVDILAFYRTILTTDLPRHLAYQMLRAGTSIAANLEEARSAYSRRDLAAKQAIALREARECCCWLRLVMVTSHWRQPAFDLYSTSAMNWSRC